MKPEYYGFSLPQSHIDSSTLFKNCFWLFNSTVWFQMSLHNAREEWPKICGPYYLGAEGAGGFAPVGATAVPTAGLGVAAVAVTTVLGGATAVPTAGLGVAAVAVATGLGVAAPVVATAVPTAGLGVAAVATGLGVAAVATGLGAAGAAAL